jgi:DNA segregation ATPase FtsK/SpoIIIE, S-DNA-T family
VIEDSIKEKLKHEIIGILLIAVAVFLFLSLVSFHPMDPSFFSYTSPKVKEIHNWMGIVGAYLSGLLFQGFGFPSFLISFVLVVFAFSFLFRWEWKYLSLKIGGWAVILITTSSFFGLWLSPIRIYSQGLLMGGFVGEIFSRNLVRYFNRPGATVLLSLILILSFVLGTGISFISLVKHLGAGFKKLVEKISTFKMVRKEGAEREKKLVKQKQEKRETKETLPAVVVEKPSPSPKKEEIKQEAFEFLEASKGFQLPSISLLEAEVEKRQKIDRDSLIMNSRILEKKLLDYGVEGKVVEVRPGPVITVYEFEPAPGVKVSRIVNLADDLALALSALSIRIVAPIPGKAVVGIEVPNTNRETVYLKEIIDSDPFRGFKSKISFGLGKDIAGEPFVVDLGRMPHLLVAGSTGSGKSVSINAMICSILFKSTPEEVRFLMIDPKMLELSDYEGIPHLLLPVVTHPKKAAAALKWLVEEMERRYSVLAEKGVRNIEHYHQRMEKELKEKGKVYKRKGDVLEGNEEKVTEPMERIPYIVVVIDELADLMMISSREVEEAITRLAQMARAVGIHLVLATQRPSVDVLTGIIKANFPARISFQVTSKVDSRTILDTIGAEHLLGAGDMLFLPPGSSKLIRLHGAFVSGGEIKRVVDFLKKQGKPSYLDPSVLAEVKKEKEAAGAEEDEYDEKYDEAVAFVAETGQASISLIQRRFRIGYNRAARIVEKMEEEGVVGPSDGIKAREVLVKKIEP